MEDKDVLVSAMNRTVIEINSLGEAWVILFKGHQLKMPSGKIIWNKERFARSAFTEACRYSFKSELQRNGDSGFSLSRFKKAVVNLEEAGELEFKRIDIKR